MSEDTCHCGKPLHYGYDGDPAHHRGMCQACDSVRCDVDPLNCQDRMGLTAFLVDRLDEDENFVPRGGCQCEAGDAVFQRPDCADRIASDVDTKRTIVLRLAEEAATDPQFCHCSSCRTLVDLANIYRGHPDFLDEWLS